MDEAAKKRFLAEAFSRVIRNARLVDAVMPSQTLEAFLFIASSSNDVQFRDVAERLGTSAPSASRNIALLSSYGADSKKGYGFVEVYEDAADRRIKRVTLTPKGKRFLESLMEPLEKHNGSRA